MIFLGLLPLTILYGVDQPIVQQKRSAIRETASLHCKTNILHSQWKVYVRSMYKSIVYSFQNTIRRCLPKGHLSSHHSLLFIIIIYCPGATR